MMMPSDYAAAVSRRQGKPPTSTAMWVRTVRHATGLNQSDFADRIKRSRGTVTNWERGEYLPDLESVEIIMRTFPDSPSLFGPTAASQPPATTKTSDPTSRFAFTRKLLEDALVRRASKLSGSQVLFIQSEIKGDISARLSGTVLDEAGADLFIDVLARIASKQG